MPSPARVLVVDRFQESRHVLCALLARTGAEVLEARTEIRAANLIAAAQPDLVLVDADCTPGAADQTDSEHSLLAAAAARTGAPIVVIGAMRRSASPLPAAQFVAKPYHYGALIRRIEELLEQRA